MSFPPWLRKDPLIRGEGLRVLRQLRANRVHTVCKEAKCPNMGECFSRGCVTFMILGDICTRHCAFCGVSHSNPVPIDESDPLRVAETVKNLCIEYCVITSVTRDDLEDGGADQFARTVSMVKSVGKAKVEVLTPDFGGDEGAVDVVLASCPEVFAHNVETIPRLYETMRSEADYKTSISILKSAGRANNVVTKSGLMLGLGERVKEVLTVLEDIRETGCEIITLGQYLPPTIRHLSPSEYLHPEEFEEYRQKALEIGFKVVFSGPFVRSSYRASEAYKLCCG